VNGRSAKYAPAEEPLFTGKIRDAETGLDYFGARYLSAPQGRFTTVDPDSAGASPADPQTWNGYSYVYNRPLTLTDPDGRCPWCVGAVVGGIGGAAASYIGQKLANSDKPVNWKAVVGAAVGGAVAGGTLGLASAPVALTTLSGTSLVETGIAVKVTTAGTSGVAGSIVARGIENGADPNKTLGNPTQISSDYALGSAGELLNAVVAPIVKTTTTAGKVVKLNEGRVARGTKTPASYGVRKAQLKTQEQVAGGATAAAAEAVIRARQNARNRVTEEERERLVNRE